MKTEEFMKKLRTPVLLLLTVICLTCTNSIAGKAENDALKAAEEWFGIRGRPLKGLSN